MGSSLEPAFLLDSIFGIATSIVVVFQELPQEMGDYGILICAGFQRRSALILNFATALTVVLGGVFGVFFLETAGTLIPILTAISAGGFLYLAASELTPELHRGRNHKRSFMQFTIFRFRIGIIWSLLFDFPNDGTNT